MATEETVLTEKESLALISQMINKAKNAYHSTGVGAMLWGAVIAICSLVKLSEIHFNYTFPFDIYLLTLLAIIPQIYISVKEKKQKPVKSYDDIFLDYVWLAFGISIFLLVHINASVFGSWEPVAVEYKSLTGHSAAFRFSEFVSPFFLLLYGMPTFITGAACKFKPMLYGGIFCWLCCIVTVYTNIKIDLLLTAFSAIIAWFIPGLFMEKEYRMAKKQEKMHV
ncbi:MAG TPA: hypothetical protein PLC48_13470 [Ferruginibacter sp.]|nr:hypothetical protein [Ferruginibacter sp.]